MKHRFNRYAHSSKESNYDIEAYFSDRRLVYTAYEVELVYEYDDESKEIKLIGADGYFLGDEKITPGELITIPEPSDD